MNTWKGWCERRFSPGPQVGPGSRMLLVTLAAIAVLALACLPALGVSVDHGRGDPDTPGWCILNWYAVCTTGTAAVTDQGLLLNQVHRPPASAFEISLNRLRETRLLFLLDSPSTAGSVRVFLDAELIKQVRVPTEGNWWLKTYELPSRGILRVELDEHVQRLTIRSALISCHVEPSCCVEPKECPEAVEPDYLGHLLVGVAVGLAGAALVWLLLGD